MSKDKLKIAVLNKNNNSILILFYHHKKIYCEFKFHDRFFVLINPKYFLKAILISNNDFNTYLLKINFSEKNTKGRF